MNRLRWLVLGVLLLSCVVGTGAVVARWVGVGSAGELVADPPEHRLRASRLEQEFELEFSVLNRSGRVVRIVGAGESCGPEGCDTVRGLPLTIAPGARHAIAVNFRAGLPGESVKEVPLYTDNPAQPVVTLRVRCAVDREPRPEAEESSRATASRGPNAP